MLKSRKVKSRVDDRIDVLGGPSRSTRVSDLEGQIRKRKRAARELKKRPGVNIVSIIRKAGKLLNAMDNDMRRSAQQMPSESQLNKDLWG